MKLVVHETEGTKYIEGPPGNSLLQNTGDIMDLLGACFEHRAHRILLHAENLTPNFFDLSSREAGEILQKLRTYNIQAAVMLTPEQMNHGKFRQMIAEENRGPHFRGFEKREDAIEWLLSS